MNTTAVKFNTLQQKYSWDCGLTCIEIIARAIDSSKNRHDEIYNKIVPGNVWTIDLAFILKSWNIDFVFYTLTAGVDVSHGELDFYKQVLAEEAPRINKLFEDAKKMDMKVETRSVDIQILINHVSSGMPAIVLVDNRHIAFVSTLSPTTGESHSFTPKKEKLSASAYQGHYILVYGYNNTSDEFEYCDPTHTHGPFWIKSYYLELARKSTGTDEDLLLIHL